MIGRLARRAFDLFVTLVADKQNLEVIAREPLRLAVNLRDERAGRVDGLQAALSGRIDNGRRHSMSTEDDMRALGHLIDFLDEHCALRLELAHDVDVVHDLLAHVDGGTVSFERLLDGDHRTIDACAVPAGRGEQDLLRPGDRKVTQVLAGRGRDAWNR